MFSELQQPMLHAVKHKLLKVNGMYIVVNTIRSARILCAKQYEQAGNATFRTKAQVHIITRRRSPEKRPSRPPSHSILILFNAVPASYPKVNA